jgi:hypothetical protein
MKLNHPSISTEQGKSVGITVGGDVDIVVGITNLGERVARNTKLK